MCTLTYVPTHSGFIVTSNRDESLKRGSAIPPTVHRANAQDVLMPQDPDKGGTWIAMTEAGRVAVLLNGAHERHKWEPPYRSSRGIVLLDSLRFNDLEAFSDQYDFEGIEPFTIITLQPGSISDFRWDYKQSHITHVDSTTPHVWSSAQLYLPELHLELVNRWDNFIASPQNLTPEALLQFNQSETYESRMQRAGIERFKGLSTVSVSSIEVGADEARFNYFNTQTSETSRTKLSLRKG